MDKINEMKKYWADIGEIMKSIEDKKIFLLLPNKWVILDGFNKNG
jgi:hypothetical protein